MYVIMLMYSQFVLLINTYNYYKNTIYWYVPGYCCKYYKFIITLDECSCILFYHFMLMFVWGKADAELATPL